MQIFQYTGKVKAKSSFSVIVGIVNANNCFLCCCRYSKCKELFSVL